MLQIKTQGQYEGKAFVLFNLAVLIDLRQCEKLRQISSMTFHFFTNPKGTCDTVFANIWYFVSALQRSFNDPFNGCVIT